MLRNVASLLCVEKDLRHCPGMAAAKTSRNLAGCTNPIRCSSIEISPHDHTQKRWLELAVTSHDIIERSMEDG